MDVGSKADNGDNIKSDSEKDRIKEEKSRKSDILHTNTDMISNSELRKEDHSLSEAHIQCNYAVLFDSLKEEMEQIRSSHKEDMRELRDRLTAKPKLKNKRPRNGSSKRCSLSLLDSGNQGTVETEMMSGRTSN